jgi:hypothetical protein
MQRIFITTSDIQILTGKSSQTALRILQRIRLQFNKPEKSNVTFREYCEFEGVSINEVYEALNLKIPINLTSQMLSK